MKRQYVNSSVLRSVGYMSTTQSLEVEFVNQPIIYLYHQVPMEKYNGLMSAESHGKYFNEHIRDNYKFSKLKEPGKH